MPSYSPDDAAKEFITPAPVPQFRKSDLDVDLDAQAEEAEGVEIASKDNHTHAPTGEPWCWFPAGALLCQNNPCENPNHRGGG